MIFEKTDPIFKRNKVIGQKKHSNGSKVMNNKKGKSNVFEYFHWKKSKVTCNSAK